MKFKELIKKAEVLFGHDSKQDLQKKCIKKVLKKLRKHQRRLEGKLEGETEVDTVKKLERKIGLTQLHRQKGLKIIKELDEKKGSEDPE